ncbi:MAG: PTS sugar transporter subunit IIA [Treponema sp.]|jgi:PTS system ascorbate-specific IIA component|nr:PTS sugar transporter subunit IIA [Treponema sp.]
MLLADIVAKKHFLFIDEAGSWEESIRQSCKALTAAGIVGEGYAEEIIECVRAHGPYIVLMPGIALPHSAENSANARGTAIAFMKVKKPVSFDDADPEKSAQVFFTLASTDTEQHLKNMRALFKMLTNEALCADLLKAESADDLLALDRKYSE